MFSVLPISKRHVPKVVNVSSENSEHIFHREHSVLQEAFTETCLFEHYSGARESRVGRACVLGRPRPCWGDTCELSGCNSLGAVRPLQEPGRAGGGGGGGFSEDLVWSQRLSQSCSVSAHKWSPGAGDVCGLAVCKNWQCMSRPKTVSSECKDTM